jgi:myosin heavy subunit
VLEQLRDKILHDAATRIQSYWRMRKYRQRFLIMHNAAIFLQAGTHALSPDCLNSRNIFRKRAVVLG